MSRKLDILNSLNEQQKAPVMDYYGPSMIIASAGAGKTRTIIARTAYMIEEGVNPSSILMFTFTRKGANEIKERIVSEIGKKAENVTVGTYHSFCMRLLRRYAENLGWDRDFTIYDTEDQHKLLKEITKLPKKDITAVSSQISRWKDRLLTPSMVLNNTSSKDNLYEYAKIYKKYQEELRKCNAFDFDDLIFYTVHLLSTYPEIKRQVNNRYKFIVADEAQDSSPRDLQLIYLLSSPTMNLCLVGDDSQLIYSFRGSNIDSFFGFIKNNKLKLYLLEQNYRSTQTIVNASNSVIKENKNQFDKNAFSKNDVGERVIIFEEKTDATEANRITQIIKQMHRRGYKYSDIAILYRTNTKSLSIEKKLITNNIPYQVLSNISFLMRKEVKDILAYLKVLRNPCDFISLKRVLTTPKKGIGDKSLEEIETCFLDSLSDIINIGSLQLVFEKAKLPSKKAKNSLNSLIDLLEKLKNSYSTARPEAMIQEIIDSTGYLDYLRKEHKEIKDYMNRKDNLNVLMEIAKQSQNIEEFIDNMYVCDDPDLEEEPQDSVKLLTIHSSKGLEWPVVIVSGLSEGTLPHFISIKEASVDEERRLFYVAMTRAKEYLFLTRPCKVRTCNGWSLCPPSRFLNEIDVEYAVIV